MGKHCVSQWHGARTAQDRDLLQHVIKTAQIIGTHILSISDILVMFMQRLKDTNRKGTPVAHLVERMPHVQRLSLKVGICQ